MTQDKPMDNNFSESRKSCSCNIIDSPFASPRDSLVYAIGGAVSHEALPPAKVLQIEQALKLATYKSRASTWPGNYLAE